MNDQEYTRVSVSTEAEQSNINQRTLMMVGGCLLLLVCLGSVAVIGLAGGIYYWAENREEWTAVAEATEAAWTSRNSDLAELFNTETPRPPTPTASATIESTGRNATASPTPSPTAEATIQSHLSLAPPSEINQDPLPERADADLQALFQMDYPSHDYYETAVRLRGFDSPRQVSGSKYEVGDTRQFYNEDILIDATLMAVTDHTYFWVEDSLNLNGSEVAAAANRFESEYYESLTDLFGQVWDPGIDNDPRMTILHVNGTAAAELGYFNSEDEYPNTLFNFSNEQEMIYLNMEELDLGDDLYFATLVHEVQHLIQWYVDPSETAWLNEGLSQLAEIYLGFDDTAETVEYLENPATQLNTWDYEGDDVYANYAGAYLFSVYVWEQLGETAIQELSRHPANGLVSVNEILQGFAPDRSLETFMADWAVANYLDAAAAAPRYYYENLDFRKPAFQAKVERDGRLELVEALNQFGVHYIDLTDVRGETTLTFAGDTAVSLIGDALHEDNVFWFAPAVNELNAQLTASFDLTALNEATLTYSVWYDLEEGYDFAYVSVSTDGGQTWETLSPESSFRTELGDGYNGRSLDIDNHQNGWVKESLSLDEYAGQTVHIRFDVLTDTGITGHGFALDDIVITELGYAGTFDEGPQGWENRGFVLTGWQIPQLWSVVLIQDGPQPAVKMLPLDSLNQGQWVEDIGKGGGVLLIMPQTPFAQSVPNYWLTVE